MSCRRQPCHSRSGQRTIAQNIGVISRTVIDDFVPVHDVVWIYLDGAIMFHSDGEIVGVDRLYGCRGFETRALQRRNPVFSGSAVENIACRY